MPWGGHNERLSERIEWNVSAVVQRTRVDDFDDRSTACCCVQVRTAAARSRPMTLSVDCSVTEASCPLVRSTDTRRPKDGFTATDREPGNRPNTCPAASVRL